MARVRGRGYGPRRQPGNVGSSGGTVGFVATFTDGAQQVVLPDYVDLPLSDVTGLAAHADLGRIAIDEAGTYLFEGRAEVKHSYGEYVVFATRVNGGDAVEFGRAQCNSDDFVFVITERRQRSMQAGDSVEFLVSSTFEWAEFAWRNTEIVAIRSAE